MNKQITERTARVLAALGFPGAQIEKADKDRVVVTVKSKFPALRKALSRQYGNCDHNTQMDKVRRATWDLPKQGTIVCKGKMAGPVRLTFSTAPVIKL